MINIVIPDEYSIIAESSSDGAQKKFYFDGYWYKIDKYGGEGIAEELASILMTCSSLEKDEYVIYETCLINGIPGCKSKNFCKENEEIISFNHAHELILGYSFGKAILGKTLSAKIKYAMDFFEQYFSIDITDYLAKTFAIDMLICNEDRNFGNLAIIYNNDSNVYRTAPIFDCGNSLLVGIEPYKKSGLIEDRIKNVAGKPFTSNLDVQFAQFQNSISIDYILLYSKLESISSSLQKEALLYLIKNYEPIFINKNLYEENER